MYILADFPSPNFFAHRFWLSPHRDLASAFKIHPPLTPPSDPILSATDPRVALQADPRTAPYTSLSALSEIGLS